MCCKEKDYNDDDDDDDEVPRRFLTDLYYDPQYDWVIDAADNGNETRYINHFEGVLGANA